MKVKKNAWKKKDFNTRSKKSSTFNILDTRHIIIENITEHATTQ